MTNTTRPKAGSPGNTYTATMRSPCGSLDLRYSVYEPAGKTEQFCVFLNGRSEYVEKYAYVVDDLQLPAATGFLTTDHRGQGASGGARAYVDDYQTYVADAKQIIDTVVGKRPYVLMAHSMGALTSLHGVLSGDLTPQALILSSPLLGLPKKPLPPQVARPVATLLSRLGLGPVSSGVGHLEADPFETNTLTHDFARYQAIVASPYRLPGATFGWVAASFKATAYCFDPTNLARLTVPTLVLTAGAEGVVDPDAARAWVQAAAAVAPAEVQISSFPGARHELLSEIPAHYREVITTIRQWFRGHSKGWEE